MASKCLNIYRTGGAGNEIVGHVKERRKKVQTERQVVFKPLLLFFLTQSCATQDRGTGLQESHININKPIKAVSSKSIESHVPIFVVNGIRNDIRLKRKSISHGT